MACVAASSMAVAIRPVAFAKASPAAKPFRAVTVSNGTIKKTTAMQVRTNATVNLYYERYLTTHRNLSISISLQVWTPINNK